MIKRQSKSEPKWTDVKAKLASFDRAGLLGLVQDLYAAHPDNRTFLHTRFGLGEDVLEPYKQTIDRWLWPDAFRKQDSRQSQESHFQLQEGRRSPRRPSRVDGLLLRAGFRFCERP